MAVVGVLSEGRDNDDRSQSSGAQRFVVLKEKLSERLSIRQPGIEISSKKRDE